MSDANDDASMQPTIWMFCLLNNIEGKKRNTELFGARLVDFNMQQYQLWSRNGVLILIVYHFYGQFFQEYFAYQITGRQPATCSKCINR